jgi:hypothetical protein
MSETQVPKSRKVRRDKNSNIMLRTNTIILSSLLGGDRERGAKTVHQRQI